MDDGTVTPAPALPCDDCGVANPPGARFCGACGHRLVTTDGTTPAADARARPGRRGPVAAAGRTETRGADAGSGRRRRRRRLVATTLVAVAALVAGVVVQRGAPPTDTVDAASRGDAARTGVYVALTRPGLPEVVAWRDVWTSSPPDRQLVPRRPLVAGLGYVVATTGGVAALDRSNGGVHWRAELSVSPAAEPLPLDDRFLAVGGSDEVTLLDAIEGTELWRTGVPGLGDVRAIAASGRTLAVAGAGSEVVLLDRVRGSLGARVSMAARVGPGPTTVEAIVAVDDGFVALVGPTGDEHRARLVAVRRDGTVSWVGEPEVTASLPLLAGGSGTVVASSRTGGVVAVDVTDGSVRWRWRLAADEGPGELAAVAVTPDGGRVLVAAASGVRRVLGITFGALVTTENAAPLPLEDLGPTDAIGRVAAPTPSGAIEVVDVGTGRAVATLPTTGSGLAVPSVDGDRVLVGLAGGRVRSEPIGPTGTSWTAAVTPAAGCPVAGAGDAVLVADGGAIRAHAAASGVRRWTVRPDGGTSAAAPVAGGGLVLAASATGLVSAADAVNGELRWVAPVEGSPVGEPVLAGDRVVVASAGGSDGGGTVTTLALGDGARGWTAAVGGPVASAPAVAGGQVAVVTRAGELVVLDLATGAERWRAALAGAPTAAPVLVGERIVVADTAGISTWSDEGGSVRELARTDLAVPLVRVPAVAGDRILVRSDSTRLVALDLTTHAVLWEAVTTTDVLTTPPTVVGTLVVAGGQRGLHGFALATGTPTARAEIGPLVGTVTATRGGVVACRVDGSVLVLE